MCINILFLACELFRCVCYVFSQLFGPTQIVWFHLKREALFSET